MCHINNLNLLEVSASENINEETVDMSFADINGSDIEEDKKIII